MHDLGDLRGRRPDVAQVDGLPVGPGPDRVVHHVDVHRPGERVRHHQRRRRQVVHLDVGVDPALEVPVAGQHGDDGQVAFVDRGADLLRQRPGVADAGRAAEADEVEAELVQVGQQAGPLVVVHDHLGAGRQRGLHPGLAAQPGLHGLLGQQRRADHDRGVGGVGARGDGRDHDRAVVDGDRGAVVQRGLRRPWTACRPAPRRSGPRRGRCRPRRRPARTRARTRSPPRGRRSWRRTALPGPAGASARRSTARWWTGRDRVPRRTRWPRAPGRATAPAPWRRPRPARRAPRGGRSAAGRPASRRRSGRSRRSSRTPGSCCRSWPGWRPGPRPRRRRGTRRTCRPRRACAAVR